MKKIMQSTSILLFLCVLALTFLVGCNVLDSNRHSIEMKSERWLYEKLPSSANVGDEITVKIRFATDLGYIFTVNDERIKQDDDVESNDYWQFSFTMPDEDVVIDFKTYDGFLPDPAYGTLIETYWMQNLDAEHVSVREYYGEYENGVLVAMIDAGDYTANEWSEKIAGYSFAYGDGNRLTVLYDGKFYTLPEAYEKEYLTKENISEIFLKYSDNHSEVFGGRTCEFSAQYIRTDGYHDGVRYPVVTVIHSVDELNAYYKANKDKYSLERRTGTISSDSTIGFLDACDKYDEEYFESQILLIVLLEEGSGSVRHKVERVANGADGITVDITTIVPEIGTCDMAEWHILIEPEVGFAEDADDITVYIDGRDATEKITDVYYEKGYANIALTLKEGWEYDIADDPNTKEFAVNIYPAGQKDNKLRIAYFNGFGVCGTGLKQEEINLGKHNAWMGTYDNNTVWDFISIKDTFGDYAILNEGGKHWWSEYGDEAMQILATLKVADGYISEAGAIQAAKEKADSADEDPEVEFDSEKALWKVTLSGKNTSGDDTFIIDVRGNIVDIIE